MINNDILRRLCTIFNFDHEKTQAVFLLGQCDIDSDKLTSFYKEKDDTAYVELLDVELASFLNGLIVEKRGAKDGAQREAEKELNNNLIFNKVKIALALKSEDVLSLLAQGELTLSKYELSAFFRNENNKHYRKCTDETLSIFLSSLKNKSQA